ncbi:ASCH domain-containing protein [Marivivens aquimaris]|uniref:hypothetical protein n=1 Tax=Marivivens aquimaris TaxID=2774876 RepID=UPI0018810B7E|nr:hypothetical protein [Marivivens aquimaris]
MVAYNFAAQFAEEVRSGRKSMTIRTARKNGHAVFGDELQLYIGMRTKNCQLLKRVTCIFAASIVIEQKRIIVDGRVMPDPEELARADGFTDFEQMKAWFTKLYGLPYSHQPFEGELICWGQGTAALLQEEAI